RDWQILQQHYRSPLGVLPTQSGRPADIKSGKSKLVFWFSSLPPHGPNDDRQGTSIIFVRDTFVSVFVYSPIPLGGNRFRKSECLLFAFGDCCMTGVVTAPTPDVLIAES